MQLNWSERTVPLRGTWSKLSLGSTALRPTGQIQVPRHFESALEHSVVSSGRRQSGKSRDGVEGRATAKPLEATADHSHSRPHTLIGHSLPSTCHDTRER